jgi:ABC-type cobalamin/Fe3+-siderophores transport system ATPase subunit
LTDGPAINAAARSESADGLAAAPAAAEPILSLDAVTYGFDRRPDFLQPVSLTIGRGQLWTLIGPNGAGKTTLLRLMAGLIAPRTGRVLLDGRDMTALPLRRRAVQIAYLPQHLPRDLGLAVRDVVLLGRFPHRRFGLFDGPADFATARDAMIMTQTAAFADRPIDTLSGGEASRVHLAAAIAQQPDVLLLDEPAAALDLAHQLLLLDILRDLTGRRRLAVVLVSHDLNFAWRAGSHVLLLANGRPVASGPPAEVMRPDILEPVYDVRLDRAVAPGAPGDWLVVAGPRPAPTSPAAPSPHGGPTP